jgi:hypothetical protein
MRLLEPCFFCVCVCVCVCKGQLNWMWFSFPEGPVCGNHRTCCGGLEALETGAHIRLSILALRTNGLNIRIQLHIAASKLFARKRYLWFVSRRNCLHLLTRYGTVPIRETYKRLRTLAGPTGIKFCWVTWHASLSKPYAVSTTILAGSKPNVLEMNLLLFFTSIHPHATILEQMNLL